MKVWTYGEMSTKIIKDNDLQQETFISSDEMVGYANEALEDAEAEILALNQDYFITKFFLPVVDGSSRYQLPDNIYANKIRGMMYHNGSTIYPISQLRRKNRFGLVEEISQYGQADDYTYALVNDRVGQAEIDLYPASRETAILAPYASRVTPIILWYLRSCARVPVTGEYCNPEIIATSQVDAGSDTIATVAGTKTYGTPQQGLPGAYPGSLAYATGDKVQVVAGPGGTLPSPLVEDTTYFIAAFGNGVVGLAATRLDAINNSLIDLTDAGTVYFTLKVAAAQAHINATLIDIPEFATYIMQWVKCRCFEKEGDPRLATAVTALAAQQQQMIDSLSKGIDDDDDQIQADFSHYLEMI